MATKLIGYAFKENKIEPFVYLLNRKSLGYSLKEVDMIMKAKLKDEGTDYYLYLLKGGEEDD